MSYVHILLVEDDSNHVMLTQMAFESSSFRGRLHVARDGKGAISYLAGEPPYQNRRRAPLPDLIILDLGLPVISGLGVLGWLSMRPDLAHIPVMVLTTSTDPEDAKRAYSMGARAFHEKQPDFMRVVEMAQEVLDRCAPRGEDVG